MYLPIFHLWNSNRFHAQQLPPDPRTARRLTYNATRDRLLRRALYGARRDIFLTESQAPSILLDAPGPLQGFDTPCAQLAVAMSGVLPVAWCICLECTGDVLIQFIL